VAPGNVDSDRRHPLLLGSTHAPVPSVGQSGGPGRMKQRIPAAVIALLSQVIPDVESHASLNSLFMHAGAPGDPPEGSKPVKVQEWLRRVNTDDSVQPLLVLGLIIEAYMEADTTEEGPIGQIRRDRIQKIESALTRQSLRYIRGGTVSSGLGPASKTFEELIRDRAIGPLDEEFARAARTVQSDPREAVSAACNILESVCKIVIEDEQLEAPSKQDLQGVWSPVRKFLGFDASTVEDQDLKQIISGLLGIVSGIGAFRTHASSAHGRGRRGYRLEPRHARLAIHAAHTVVAFIVESWEQKRAGSA
jgi:hypothetical protein